MRFNNLKNNFGIYLSLIFTLLVSAGASGQDFSRYDLSTDAGATAAREARLGKELSKLSRGCLKRPAELPEIILVGSFAHDRGCLLTGAFIGKRLFDNDEKMSEYALESLGWRKANAKKKEEIALRWTQFGLLSFNHPLVAATEDFAGRDFHAPQASADAGGNVIVTLWTRRPAGMRCEIGYDRLSFTFAADAVLSERKTLESFAIPCKRN